VQSAASGDGAEPVGERAHLLLGEQHRVVARVALRREAPALDRVREDHRRPLPVGRRVGVGEQAEVVPAEVADQLRQLERLDVPDEARHRAAGAGAGRRRARPEEARRQLVRPRP
jgi:hypothetical protein